MNRFLIFPVLAFTLTFTVAPAQAVVYCKTVGVPKGCVMRPGAPAVVVPAAPAARAVVAPKPGNWNGGANRLGVRR